MKRTACARCGKPIEYPPLLRLWIHSATRLHRCAGDMYSTDTATPEGEEP